MFFSHEKLKVYKRAIELVSWRRKQQDTEMGMKMEMKMKSEENMHTTYDALYKPAVIIVSWNCKDALKQCLASLKKYSPPDVEILVVDNASSDGTPEAVAAEFPEVRLLAQKQNLGFARANNLAASATDAEYLFILNPDTQICPGAIQTLTGFLDSTPDAALAAPLLLDDKGCPLTSAFNFPTVWNFWTEHSILFALCQRIKKKTLKKSVSRHPTQSNRPREIDWATGAAFMIRRSALGDEQLFDERFFMYSEDADLCKRLDGRGWKRFLVPPAKVVHSHRKSSRKALSRTIFHLFNSIDLYFAKHKSAPARFLLRLSIAIDMLSRLFILSIFPGKEYRRLENKERRKGYRKVLRRLNPFNLHPAKRKI